MRTIGVRLEGVRVSSTRTPMIIIPEHEPDRELTKSWGMSIRPLCATPLTTQNAG